MACNQAIDVLVHYEDYCGNKRHCERLAEKDKIASSKGSLLTLIYIVRRLNALSHTVNSALYSSDMLLSSWRVDSFLTSEVVLHGFVE